jgi:S1-C subfamily serine protease
MAKKGIIVIVSIALLFALFNVFRANKTAEGSVAVADIGAASVDDSAGARLESVDAIGYASMLGLKAGDIVCKINGKTVKGANSFVKLLTNVMDQSKVSIEILRNGAEETISRGINEGGKVSDSSSNEVFLRHG